jgi:hypothetical protein
MELSGVGVRSSQLRHADPAESAEAAAELEVPVADQAAFPREQWRESPRPAMADRAQ